MTVFYNKHRKKWQARIWNKGQQIDLGCFPSEYEASVAFAAEIEKLKDEIPTVRVHSADWFDKESKRQRIEFSNKYQ
jgi:hypothetical protein